MRLILIIFICSVFTSCRNYPRVNGHANQSLVEGEFLISSLSETEIQDIQNHIDFKTNIDDLTYGYLNNVLGCQKVENPRICDFCMGKNEPSELAKDLMSEGLEFVGFEDIERGHCFGLSACFVKFLNQNPEFVNWDVKTILNNFYNQKDFKKNVHDVSLAQPARMFPLYAYTRSYLHKEISSEKYDRCLSYYFETIFGKDTWFDHAIGIDERDPKLFHEALIFSNLKKLDNKIIFVSLALDTGFHGIVVVNVQGRYLLFSPSDHLVEFRSLEKLSRHLPYIFKKAALRYMFVFDAHENFEKATN